MRGELLAELDAVSAGYGGATAIEDVSFAVRGGERVGVLGPNGGGKSTLFKVMLGLLPARSGAVHVRSRLGYVPQSDRSRLDYPVSALDVVLMGGLARRGWWRRPGRAERRQALEALERVGLESLASATFGELSGGQRQRVLIARALVAGAELLLMDEPFAGVDAASAERLMAIIDRLAGEGNGVMIATHDIEQTLDWDLVLCLNRRQIAFGPPESTLTPRALEETHGGAIIRLPPSRAGDEPQPAVVPPHHHDHEP
jgi:ABC-type Mn2+/Zn2+ transport system ATPase subunit